MLLLKIKRNKLWRIIVRSLHTKVKTCTASFTVEAALIIPLITILVVLVIFFNFYLHDRVRFQAEINQIIADSDNLIQYEINKDGSVLNLNRSIFYLYFSSKTEEKQFLKDAIIEHFSQGLFIGKIDSVTVSTNLMYLTVKGKLTYDIPFLSFLGLYSFNTIEMPFEVKTAIFPREETTRILEIALKTGQGIKGVGDGIEKVAKLLNELR